MIFPFNQTDWCANICTLIAGGCSAFVAYYIWSQQKKIQKEQVRYERLSQVARLKNLLVDIQFVADDFPFRVNSLVPYADVRTRESLYQSCGRHYDHLSSLRNELLREKRFATILSTSKECQKSLSDLENMIQFQLHSWYVLSNIFLKVQPEIIQQRYSDSASRHDLTHSPDDQFTMLKILMDIFALDPDNPYMAQFNIDQFIRSRELVFRSDSSIYKIIDSIVENN